MRAIWSGSLTFGLVNIPVKLYAAVERQELAFHFLHKDDLSPIRFAKVCKTDGQEVGMGDLVRGYEYEKGQYVVIDDEDFEKANVRETHAIDINQFVERDEINAALYERPYFLEPAPGAGRAYALLRAALQQSGRVGLGKFVLRKTEHLVAVKPEGDVLILEQLRFAHEIRSPTKLDLPEATDVPQAELDLALQLIGQRSGTFHPDDYRDTYTDELRMIIAQKVEGHIPSERGTAPEPVRTMDLMAALKESLAAKPRTPTEKTEKGEKAEQAVKPTKRRTRQPKT